MKALEEKVAAEEGEAMASPQLTPRQAVRGCTSDHRRAAHATSAAFLFQASSQAPLLRRQVGETGASKPPAAFWHDQDSGALDAGQTTMQAVCGIGRAEVVATCHWTNWLREAVGCVRCQTS